MLKNANIKISITQNHQSIQHDDKTLQKIHPSKIKFSVQNLFFATVFLTVLIIYPIVRHFEESLRSVFFKINALEKHWN